MARGNKRDAQVRSGIPISHRENIARVKMENIHGGKNVASGKITNVGPKVTPETS